MSSTNSQPSSSSPSPSGDARAAGPMTALSALSDARAAIVERTGRSTVAVKTGGRHGGASGVMWRANTLVSVAPVFRRAPDAVRVVIEGGAEIDAALVGIDNATDLAVFRLEGSELPCVDVEDAASVRAGQWVVAVGRSARGDLTASDGMVHSAGGRWQTWLGGQLDRSIRLDGGLHEGMSGGPVVNAAGSVFGIGTSALSRSQGMVVPAATVSRVVDALLAKGRVSRAFLGIAAQPVDLSAALGSSTAAGEPEGAEGSSAGTGLLITSLVAGGPAARAGVMVGDIVRDVAGHAAASLHDLRDALADRVGESVRMSIFRGGAPVQLSVTIGEWSARSRRC